MPARAFIIVSGRIPLRPVFLLVACLLAACSGGSGSSGGSGGDGRESPQPGKIVFNGLAQEQSGRPALADIAPLPSASLAPASDAQAAEAYAQSYHEFSANALAPIKAHYAYYRGYTGEGVVIGILDSGFDADHPELDDQLAPSSIGKHNLESISGTIKGTDHNIGLDYDEGHGTLTASVAGAAKDDEVFHGIAYDSQLSLRNLNIRSSPVTGRGFGLTFSLLLADMLADGVDVLNLSLSYGPVHDVTSLDGTKVPMDAREVVRNLTNAQIDHVFFRRGEALNGARTLENDVVLLAVAGGNSYTRHRALVTNEDYAKNPIHDAGLAVYYPELRDQFVTVVAVDSYNHSLNEPPIADFSNRCGIAGPWCLAAPGYLLDVAKAGGGYDVANGTSVASPLVAGSLAILIQKFGMADDPAHHGNAEILRRLLQTANKSGIYAPDSIYDPTERWTLSPDCDNDRADDALPNCQFSSIYGMGLVDLDAATRPWDELSAVYGPASTASLKTTARAPAGRSHIALSPAFGDAFAKALAGRTAYLFDALDFAFPVPASSLAPASSSSRFAARLAALGRPEQEAAALWPRGYRGPGAYGARGARFGPGSHLFLLPPALAQGRAHFLSAPGAHAALVRQADGAALAWAGNGHSLGFAFAETRKEAENEETASRMAMLGYGYQTGSGLNLALRTGVVEEDESLLGAATSGLYTRAKAGQAFFAGFGASMALGQNWHFFADVEAGQSEASRAASGAFASDPLISASADIGFWRHTVFSQGDWLGLMASQPLRVERGKARFSYASGRKSGALVVMRHENLSLAPSARAVDIQLAYASAPHLTPYRWHAAAGLGFNPGHQRAAKPERWIIFGWRQKF